MTKTKKKQLVKRPPRTIKEKKFVKEYLKTGNATEAGDLVYNGISREVNGAIGRENLQRLTIIDIFEKNKLTDKDLLKYHNEGLAATRAISVVSGKEANSETVDFVDVPDHQVRFKHLELIHKLKKNLVPGGVSINVDSENAQVVFNITKDTTLQDANQDHRSSD